MATLTIRNLPEDVHARLREQARRNRRSLNQEVIATLTGSAVERSSSEEQKKLRADGMIGRVAHVRAGIKRFMTAEEIDAAIREGRR